MVNGELVAKTYSKQAHFNFPTFDVDIGENFQIYLFTMPLSIEVSLRIGGTKMQEVARIPIEIPGERVKALTSTYSIAREITFSCNEWKAEKKRKKRALKIQADEGQIT